MKTLLKILIGIILVALIFGGEWIIVCGILKLICWCFALTFSLKIATGVWLVLLVVSYFLKANVSTTKNDN